ncbi:MAG: glutathione S-transferase zeta 1 [Pseudomonadota bacterium]
MTVRLYNYFRSSASWRVRIALAWKGLPYEYVSVNLVANGGEQWSEAYRQVNPLRAVPTLELDGRRVSESLAIIDLLEELHPEPALLPKEPFARAAARRLAEAVNAGIQPLQNLRVLKKLETDFGADEDARKAWAGHFNRAGLEVIEALLQETAGAYCVGDAVSVADVCLAPQLYSARRYGVDVATFPTITAIETRLNALPAFAGAHPSKQPDCPPELR